MQSDWDCGFNASIDITNNIDIYEESFNITATAKDEDSVNVSVNIELLGE